MLFAALVPVGALLFVQAEHDTRGFTDVPSPDEALAEQVRRQNAASGFVPRHEYRFERQEYVGGTRSREMLLQGGAAAPVAPSFAVYDRRGPLQQAGGAGIGGYQQQDYSARQSYRPAAPQIAGDASVR